jgi:type I protein arginine methyltransferase
MMSENLLFEQEDSDKSDEEGWLDIEPEESDILSFVSLFDDEVFPDVQSMLGYCKEKYNFDFMATRKNLDLDFYGTIKLINFSMHRILIHSVSIARANSR